MTVRRMSAQHPVSDAVAAQRGKAEDKETAGFEVEPRPPKAEARGSNPFGCASPTNHLAPKTGKRLKALSAECPRYGLPGRSLDDFAGRAIYDGRDRLGEVFDLGCRSAAQLADGTDLGTFPSIEIASQAILAAARAPR